MARQLHTPVKQVTDKPFSTLQFVGNDDPSIKSITETTVKGKKAEKSVHFASDNEAISSSQLSEVTSLDNSQDLISWMPSEHLYSDTFITETHADTSSDKVNSDPSAVTYGSNTFINESETNTESEYSSARSLSSSEVFSAHTASETYREWRDVTEIIKDIEDLEESEFVRHRLDDAEDTDEFSDSLEHEIAEEARQDFLVSAIRRLTLASHLSPGSESSLEEPGREHNHGQMKQKSKEQMSFCQKMIQRCRDNEGLTPPASLMYTSELHTKAEMARQPMQPKVLEHYGLNSALVNRLKVDNLLLRMDKKSRDLDKETKESLNFVHGQQYIEEDEARRKFISQATAQVRSLSVEDRIQEHLICMHPVKWFADFVNDLPNMNEDSREILYKYKKQIEKRMEESGS